MCFYGGLKLAGVRVDDQVGCAPAHQQTVQMPRKLRQEKTHLSLRFCSPAPPEPPKKASPLRSMPATRVTRPCVLKQRHCTKYGIHAHVTSRVSILVCVFVHCVCVCAIYVRLVRGANERYHVFIGNEREQLQKEPAQVPSCRNRAR